MDQSDFPIINSFENLSARLGRILEAINSAKDLGQIRNAKLKELRRSLLYLLDLFWTEHIRNRYIFGGKMDNLLPFLREFYYGLNVMSIKTVMSIARKVDKFKAEYVIKHKQNQSDKDDEMVIEFVSAVEAFIVEAIPLCRAVEELSSVAINGREPSTSTVVINPNKIVKTCPCCLRQIAVGQDGNMVHHGFKRTGQGYQTQSCVGIRFKPLEESTEGLEWMVDSLKSQLARTEERIENKDNIQSFGVSDRSGKLTVISRGDENWDSRFRVYIEGLKSEARYLTRDIKNMSNVLTEWKAIHQEQNDNTKH